MRYFKMASEKGNPIGHAGLGQIYLYGSGVEKDYAKALKHFQLSADQNYVEGHFLLGIMYFYGYGIKKDYKHLNLAAQLGHVLGFYNLAQMHASGTGVLRSCTTATELYKNVAERGVFSHKLVEAYTAYKENDIDKALIKYLLLSELGMEVAQSNSAYIMDQCN
jgi:SEL1 protein